MYMYWCLKKHNISQYYIHVVWNAPSESDILKRWGGEGTFWHSVKRLDGAERLRTAGLCYIQGLSCIYVTCNVFHKHNEEGELMWFTHCTIMSVGLFWPKLIVYNAHQTHSHIWQHSLYFHFITLSWNPPRKKILKFPFFYECCTLYYIFISRKRTMKKCSAHSNSFYQYLSGISSGISMWWWPSWHFHQSLSVINLKGQQRQCPEKLLHFFQVKCYPQFGQFQSQLYVITPT